MQWKGINPNVKSYRCYVFGADEVKKVYCQQMFMSIFKNVLNFIGLRSVRSVVFIAPVDFHLQHLMPVIEKLCQNKSISIFIVVGEGQPRPAYIKNIFVIDQEEFHKMYWKIHDVVVTTEFDCIPYWYLSGNRIAMFHGAGPKKGYLERLTGKEFDFIFSPGPFIYNLEINILKKIKASKTKVIPVGLPSIDRLASIAGESRENKLKNTTKILYAPSWHWDPSLISMDEEILKALSLLDNVHVMVRPHPNLLKTSHGGNTDWASVIGQYEGLNFVLSSNEPINDLLAQADVILGDISSVMYEYLVLDKPGILYVRDETLRDSIYSNSIQPLIDAYIRIDSAKELPKALACALADVEEKKTSRQRLKDDTFFNIGEASRVAANEIEKIAKN